MIDQEITKVQYGYVNILFLLYSTFIHHVRGTFRVPPLQFYIQSTQSSYMSQLRSKIMKKLVATNF